MYSHEKLANAAADAAGLLHEQEAARFLAISFRTLQTWRVRGGGPRFCKIGRAVRYRRRDLIDWVEEQSRASTCDQGSQR